jgi:hypothetical protein
LYFQRANPGFIRIVKYTRAEDFYNNQVLIWSTEMNKIALAGIMFAWLGTSCKQEQIDKDIKKQLALKAKTEIHYAGLYYTVAEGVLTLSGKSPTEKAKQAALKEIEGLAGVKQVIDQIQVAPVVIGTDYTLKYTVDSVLTEYPLALAEVQDSVITLRGQVKGKQLQNLLTGIDDLHPKQVHNLLLVQEGS